ncbi:MAG TPA: substrate-binding domain-containing protein [Clostridiaceae bacterium]
MKTNTSINGIFGANQQSLEGIAQAVKELGKTNSIKIVGFDSSYTIISDLENGIIDAIVVQRPYNMGYLSVKAAVDAIKGKKLPSNIYTNFQLITKENIYTPENEKLLFPF